jgi:hypothetical protein
MVTLASVLLSGCVLQGGSVTVQKLVEASEAAGASSVDKFTKALDEKQWDTAEAETVPLVGHYQLIVQWQKKFDPNGDARSRDLLASLHRSRKALVAALDRAVNDPRAAPKLQQTILGKFGTQPDEGEKLAVRAIDLKHVNDVPASRAAAITAVGSLRNPKYVDLFERCLHDPRAEVLDAAAHAMGEYFAEKEAERKRIVGILIPAYESAEMGLTRNPQQQPPRTDPGNDVVASVRNEIQIALARLTGGTHFDSAKAWAEWYRDAKSTKWRDGVDKVSIPPNNVQPGSGH